MKINDIIRDKKLQYNLNKDTAKTSISSSGKIKKYEVLQMKKSYLLIEAN